MDALPLAGHDGEILPTANGRRVRLHRAVPVDLPGGETVEHLVERDAAFEPGEGRSKTEVDAVAEGQVVADLAVDVEAVAVGELAIVAVGRAVEHDHDAALGNRLAVVLDVAGDVAGLHR